MHTKARSGGAAAQCGCASTWRGDNKLCACREGDKTPSLQLANHGAMDSCTHETAPAVYCAHVTGPTCGRVGELHKRAPPRLPATTPAPPADTTCCRAMIHEDARAAGGGGRPLLLHAHLSHCHQRGSWAQGGSHHEESCSQAGQAMAAKMHRRSVRSAARPQKCIRPAQRYISVRISISSIGRVHGYTSRTTNHLNQGRRGKSHALC